MLNSGDQTSTLINLFNNLQTLKTMKHIYILIIATIGMTLESCNQEEILIGTSTRAESKEISIEDTYTTAQQAIVKNMTNNILLMYGNKIAVPALPQDLPFGIQYAILTSKLP